MQQDLTQGSIPRHLLSMATFIGLGLLFQTLYLLVDLFFVSRLGPAAIAGVSAAGVASFLVMGLTQLVAVGGLALTAQAIGRKDMDAASHNVSQSVSLSLAFAVVVLVVGYAAGEWTLSQVAADAATLAAGRDYLFWTLPSLALMFPGTALGSGLRAAGVVQPTMYLQTLTVLLNAVLAPVLIAGWGTGVPLGVAGAGLATSISVAVGFAATIYIFPRVQTALIVRRADLKPNFSEWKRIIGVGLPAAGEMLLMFVVIGIVYWVIRHFGPHAQAGFGVASRVMQSIFLPAMAVAFGCAPIVGQNFGAGRADRVRATFRTAAIYSTGIMLTLTLLCQVRPDLLVGFFTDDPEALHVGADYLRIASWSFVATGLVFTCSSTFQGLGDTRPALFSSGTRLVTFALPAFYLGSISHPVLNDFWYLSLASVWLQAATSVVLLLHTLRVKLGPAVAPAPA
jgi:putative MATE family efflux protein